MDRQKKEDRRLAYTALVFLFLYVGVMIIASCIPGQQLQDTVIPTYSGVFHFLEFLLFGFIAATTFALFDVEYFFSSLTVSIIFMSVLTEGIQYFVPGRIFSITDLVVNVAGGLTFILITVLFTIIGIILGRRGGAKL